LHNLSMCVHNFKSIMQNQGNSTNGMQVLRWL
jgi:hypothetical protein